MINILLRIERSDENVLLVTSVLSVAFIILLLFVMIYYRTFTASTISANRKAVHLTFGQRIQVHPRIIMQELKLADTFNPRSNMNSEFSYTRCVARAIAIDPNEHDTRVSLFHVPEVVAQDFSPTEQDQKEFHEFLEQYEGKWDEIPPEERQRADKLLWAKDNNIRGQLLSQIVNQNKSPLESFGSSSAWELYVASNSLQSNFKVANGFMIVDGRMVSKTAPGIHQTAESFKPLSGSFSMFVTEPMAMVGISRVEILDGQLNAINGISSKYAASGIQNAISGPPIVRNSTITKLRQRDVAKFQHAKEDEVNWDPETTTASWSSIGYTISQESTQPSLILCHLIGLDTEHQPLVDVMAHTMLELGCKGEESFENCF